MGDADYGAEPYHQRQEGGAHTTKRTGRLTTRIEIWAKPGASADAIQWDPWRRRWVVACRAPPAGGQANEAIRRLVAERLEVPDAKVRWVRAGRSRTKVIEVDGLSTGEVQQRLADGGTPGAAPVRTIGR